MALSAQPGADNEKEKGEIRLNLTLTHEEIAQMIVASRETVTRLFAEFKRKKLIKVHGSTSTRRSVIVVTDFESPA